MTSFYDSFDPYKFDFSNFFADLVQKHENNQSVPLSDHLTEFSNVISHPNFFFHHSFFDFDILHLIFQLSQSTFPSIIREPSLQILLSICIYAPFSISLFDEIESILFGMLIETPPHFIDIIYECFSSLANRSAHFRASICNEFPFKILKEHLTSTKISENQRHHVYLFAHNIMRPPLPKDQAFFIFQSVYLLPKSPDWYILFVTLLENYPFRFVPNEFIPLIQKTLTIVDPNLPVVSVPALNFLRLMTKWFPLLSEFDPSKALSCLYSDHFDTQLAALDFLISFCEHCPEAMNQIFSCIDLFGLIPSSPSDIPRSLKLQLNHLISVIITNLGGSSFPLNDSILEIIFMNLEYEDDFSRLWSLLSIQGLLQSGYNDLLQILDERGYLSMIVEFTESEKHSFDVIRVSSELMKDFFDVPLPD